MAKKESKKNVKSRKKVVKKTEKKKHVNKQLTKQKKQKPLKSISSSEISSQEKTKNVAQSKKQEKKTLLLYCPRCKRETDNVITGFIGQKIRRVRCEVCKTESNYHRILTMKKRMEGGSDSDTSESTESILQQNYRMWEDLMLGRDPETARQYNIKDKYFENDLINHPVFGVGVVKVVKEDYKIEVVFKNGIKILAHNRFMSSR